MLGDVGDDRAFEAKGRVVPADAGTRLVRIRVATVACQVGQVDPPDVGDAVVDEHELLVMAVQRPFLGVEVHLDARAVRQLVAQLADLPPVRAEERQRRIRVIDQLEQEQGWSR